MRDRGTITEVFDRGANYHINYAYDEGGWGSFKIGKNEAMRGSFIASSQGRRVVLDVDNKQTVCMVWIDGSLVLQR